MCSVNKRVLVAMPHPDDETLLCAGVIYSALQAGDIVYVLLATPGDFNGVESGIERMLESAAAMDLLGLPKNNLIFLNYGDNGGLEQFGQRFTDSLLYRMLVVNDPAECFRSRAGRTETYNGPFTSYHHRVYGCQAAYTRQNFLNDLQSVIHEIRPDEIYTSSRFDMHADHASLYFFIIEAIRNLRRQDMAFCPIVYEALAHACEGDKTWPPQRKHRGFFPMPKALETATLLDWNRRVSIKLPSEMWTPAGGGLKAEALCLYNSQRCTYVDAFARRDEIFWAERCNGISCFATATASSELQGEWNCEAAKAIDGVADGFSNSLARGGLTSHNRFPFAEWVSNGERSGAWLQLDWQEPYTVNRIVLYDRPNPDDRITGATLLFSDGFKLMVGPLPPDGRQLEICFPERSIRWVKLSVDTVSANTRCVGIAEIEVFCSRS